MKWWKLSSLWSFSAPWTVKLKINRLFWKISISLTSHLIIRLHNNLTFSLKIVQLMITTAFNTLLPEAFSTSMWNLFPSRTNICVYLTLGLWQIDLHDPWLVNFPFSDPENNSLNNKFCLRCFYFQTTEEWIFQMKTYHEGEADVSPEFKVFETCQSVFTTSIWLPFCMRFLLPLTLIFVFI